jgi:hypothetical protein
VDRLIVPGAHTTDEVDPQLLKWAADRDLQVELVGGRADAEFSFDAMLRDLAAHTDRTTALFALTLTAAIGLALVPTAITHRDRR